MQRIVNSSCPQELVAHESVITGASPLIALTFALAPGSVARKGNYPDQTPIDIRASSASASIISHPSPLHAYLDNYLTERERPWSSDAPEHISGHENCLPCVEPTK